MHIDLNRSSIVQILKIKGMDGKLARKIIDNRPYFSFDELVKKNPDLKQSVVDQMKKHGYSFSIKQTGKKPRWYPRPRSQIDVSTGRARLLVSEPRSEITFGFDIQDERIPLTHISSSDDSVEFEIENNLPYFDIQISGGKMHWSTLGIQIQKGRKIQSYEWKKDKKKISRIIASLTLKDKKYQEAALKLGDGLRAAMTATRGVGATIGSERLMTDENFKKISINLSERAPSIISPVPGLPSYPTFPSVGGGMDYVFPTDGNCTLFGTATSMVEDLVGSIRKVVKCTLVSVVEAVEECIDPIPDCLADARRSLDSCKSRCNRRYRKWYNKWMRGPCKAACYVKYGIDVAVCLAKSLICTIVETVKKVWQCITKQGPVYDEPAQTGDIRVYEAEGFVGKAIDYATCGYGYSHAALVCDDKLIHATGDGMVVTDTDHYGDRKFVTLRLNLTDAQKKALCECMRTMAESGTDYDYLEALTFGTIDDPGKEICTMSIMHCLDNMGYDRSALGLDGFVSPNELARKLGAPNARRL